MKKYLVTGAAGFIGANFVKYLLDKWGKEVDILILDVLTYAGNLLTLKEELKLDNVSFVKGDIGDRELVEKLMTDFDPDYVVNFAAESHVDRSITNPRLFLETNILGTQNMLDCARKAWYEGKNDDGTPRYRAGKKFLQISTDEVYGSLSKDFDAPQPLSVSDDVKRVIEGRDNLQTFGQKYFTETTPLAPRSPYSAAKTSGDLIVLAYHETYGMPINITRCSNNYGPYHFPEKLIPLMIQKALRDEKLPVYGNGENVRDWLYVGDHCTAIDLVVRKGRDGEVYNIGGHNERTNLEVVKTILRTLGIPETLISFVKDRPGHDLRYAIDPTKIENELGWKPEHNFDTGIEATIKWNLDNQKWLRNVESGEYQNWVEKHYGK